MENFKRLTSSSYYKKHFMLYKKYILSAIIGILFTSISGLAQTKSIVQHTIQTGESLSALAKQYNTTVGDIMRLNQMNADSKLIIGQIVKIPTVQVKVVPPVQPVQKRVDTIMSNNGKGYSYYTVVKGDNLYRISKTYKVSEAQLMAWNNMPDNVVKIGQNLIVAMGVLTSAPAETKPVVVNPPVVKEAKPAEKFPSTPVVINTPKDTVAATVVKPVAPVQVTNTELIPINGTEKFIDAEGFFARYFDRKRKSDNGFNTESATFNSTSGWNDKKYYVLINDVAQGTIVRITANGKSVCAKVLGPLPNMPSGIKEDPSIKVRITNAAANILGVDASKFSIQINY